MKLTRLLFVSIIGLLLMAPMQAQTPMPSSGMDPNSMKSQMEKDEGAVRAVRTQMEQIQTLMKDNMAKMAAADAAMKSHMEAEQAKMKSQMELQEALISQLQTMTDNIQAMADRMAMMPDPMEMRKKDKKK